MARSSQAQQASGAGVGAVGSMMGRLVRTRRARARVALAVAAASMLVVAPAGSAVAAPGDLDASFGTGGIVVTEFPDSESVRQSSVAVRPDGGVVVAGYIFDSSGSEFAVTLYDARGVLETSFGNGGTVRTHLAGYSDQAVAVALQVDGKIAVAGNEDSQGGGGMTVARYRVDGSLDSSFGTDGIARIPSLSAWAVALQDDGKIVLAGACCFGEFSVVRLTAAGALDTSFGGDGWVSTDFAPGPRLSSSYARAVAVQADGRIVAAGRNFSEGTSPDFAIARYRSDGSPDRSFGHGGRTITDFAGYDDEIRSLAIDSRGRIVAGGQACKFPGNSDENCDFGLARYTSQGLLDPTFGRGGKVRTNLGSDILEGIRGVVIQPSGRIVAAGETPRLGGFAVGLARYRSDGRLDRGFGTAGLVVSHDLYRVGGLALAPHGKIVVAGAESLSMDARILRLALSGQGDLRRQGWGCLPGGKQPRRRNRRLAAVKTTFLPEGLRVRLCFERPSWAEPLRNGPAYRRGQVAPDTESPVECRLGCVHPRSARGR